MPVFQPGHSSTGGLCFPPTIKHAIPFSSDNDGSSTYDDDDDHENVSLVMVAMPSAHGQLLSRDHPSSEALKGHDHRQSSGHEPQLSAETQQWLLDSLGEDVVISMLAPGLVRVPSCSSLESDDSSTGTAASDDDVIAPAKARGVSFAPAATIQPIPHSSDLSPAQRRRMFATSSEVRRNKRRNKKEFRYDGCNWRTTTEERDMYLNMVTGDIVHPVHCEA